MKKLKKLLMIGLLALSLSTSVMPTMASESSQALETASNEWKNQVRSKLNRFYTDLKMINQISDENIKRMDRIYNSAMTYMQNAALTVSELSSYEASIEGYLNDIAGENTSGTEKFLMLSNEVPIMDVQYGQGTFVVLSLINLGKTDITDVVITPTVSNDRKEWPFVIDQPYNAQTIQIIQAADTTEEAYEKRMNIGWNFVVREDVLTGCYPLKFHATYYQDGAIVETDITTYINVKGQNPKETLIGDETQLSSNPRIIVTGFTTEPEVVYAGDVFKLTISVMNTSQETKVENVLFNLAATVEGSTNSAAYAAFLPTSGSSSVYTSAIGPGQTYEMSMEMEAKADLEQKPYVLTVNMKYDTSEQINLTDSASVSIPVKQESKMDTSTAEVLPETIAVGEQSNVMFSVYNTGKTTLYNVQVTYESDCIESGVTYLGNIAPGATANVDSMVTGIAPDDGSGIVKAVVTYEDEAGNASRFEKDLSLYVYEMQFDDSEMMGDGYEMEPMEEPTSGPSIGMIIAIAAGVVVVLIIIIVVLRKRKKAKQHKDNIDLLDEDDV